MTTLNTNRFPTQQSLTLALSIKAVADAFKSAKNNYNLIEAFPSAQNYVGIWTKDENIEIAQQAVDIDKKFLLSLSYMTYDTTGIKMLTGVVTDEVDLPEGVSVNFILPLCKEDPIVAVLRF